MKFKFSELQGFEAAPSRAKMGALQTCRSPVWNCIGKTTKFFLTFCAQKVTKSLGTTFKVPRPSVEFKGNKVPLETPLPTVPYGMEKSGAVRLKRIGERAKKERTAYAVLLCYLISCSKLLNSGVSKNSANVISRPSQINLMVRIFGFWLFP